jgi:hypothetical protein
VRHNWAVLTLSCLAIKKNGRTPPGSPVRTQRRPVLNSVAVLSKARYPRMCSNCCGSHLLLPSDEDKWLHAPGSPIRTLAGPLSILSLRTCHDFNMCASQQTFSHAISFLRGRWQAGFPVQCESGQNPHVSHPQLHCSQSVFPAQCNLCVLNPIRRS